MKNFKLIASCLALLISISSIAQEEEKEAKTSNFKFDLTYLNDNVYLGRKDSVTIPYLTPTLGYYHKSGLFVTVSSSYLTTESRMDAFTLSGGYTFTNKSWEGEVTFERSYYSGKSYSVKSESKGDFSSNISYTKGFLKPSFTGTLTFGVSTDYATTLGVEHSFSLFSDKGDLSPSVSMNASTQNGYNAYYKKRKFIKTKQGKTIPYTVTANALDATRFKVMDYEAALPLSYSAGKCTFTFTPTLAMPVNPNQIFYTLKSGSGPGINRTYTEHIGSTFFWSVGGAIKF